jgi:hypothetical protein
LLHNPAGKGKSIFSDASFKGAWERRLNEHGQLADRGKINLLPIDTLKIALGPSRKGLFRSLVVLSKPLAVPMYPVGLAIMLALACETDCGAGFGHAGRRPPVFFSLAPVRHWLLRGLGSRYQPLLENPGASAIVSLGGYARPAVPPRQYA